MGLFGGSKDAVTIGDMTVGYDGSGMGNFSESLKEMYVEQVSKELDTLEEDIKTALSECWTGESKDKYVQRFEKQIESTQDELKNEWKDLSARLEEIGDFYKNQDKALAE